MEVNPLQMVEKLESLEKENKELNYWIEKVKKDNDWLRGYEKAWKELWQTMPWDIPACDDYEVELRQIWGKLEQKYLKGE